MIAENVVITTDYEGNNYYIPVGVLDEFLEWCESEPDGSTFEKGTPFEDEQFVVNIIKKIEF